MKITGENTEFFPVKLTLFGKCQAYGSIYRLLNFRFDNLQQALLKLEKSTNNAYGLIKNNHVDVDYFWIDEVGEVVSIYEDDDYEAFFMVLKKSLKQMEIFVVANFDSKKLSLEDCLQMHGLKRNIVASPKICRLSQNKSAVNSLEPGNSKEPPTFCINEPVTEHSVPIPSNGNPKTNYSSTAQKQNVEKFKENEPLVMVIPKPFLSKTNTEKSDLLKSAGSLIVPEARCNLFQRKTNLPPSETLKNTDNKQKINVTPPKHITLNEQTLPFMTTHTEKPKDELKLSPSTLSLTSATPKIIKPDYKDEKSFSSTPVSPRHSPATLFPHLEIKAVPFNDDEWEE